MGVVFGLLAAVLVVATNLPLVGIMAFVGVCVAVVAAVVDRLPTVVMGAAADGSRWRLGAKAAFRAQRCAAQACS
jgi:isochorismate hydrolase